jgi:hypothetical protein
MSKDAGESTGTGAGEARFAKWEATRKRGPLRYIIFCGVLGWGLLTGVAFSVVFPFVMSPGPTFRQMAPVTIPVFAVGGLVWGGIMWLVSDYQYLRWRERRREPQEGR